MNDLHLDPEGISGLASGRLAGSERAAALAHVEACASCRADLTYLVGFERRRRRRRAAVILSGVAAAAVVVVLLPRGEMMPVDALRAGEEGVPLVASHQPGQGAVLAADSARFVWGHMGAGTSYRFHISTVEGVPVLETAVRDTALYVDLGSRFGPGQYFWFVDALLSDGGAARSNVWSFTIRE